MKRLNLPLLYAVLLMLTVGSGLPVRAGCRPVEVRGPEGNFIVPGVQASIPYLSVGGRDLLLDAYIQKGKGPHPALVFVHGGGWTSGSRIVFLGQLMEAVTKAGYNWFSIDYRLGPVSAYPAALEDIGQALEFIRCHAGHFKTDPQRLALVAEDAGAHLAALTALDGPQGVRAAALLGGFYDLRSLDLAPLKGAPERIRAEASPLLRLPDSGSQLPDLLLIHGGADSEVPAEQALNFCRRLQQAGGNCEIRVEEGAIHRIENWVPSQWGYKRRLLDWLAARLRPQPGHEPYRTRLQKNIVFDASTGLAMDAYIPEGSGPFPAVLVVHGGGWEAGDKVTYLTPVLEPLARSGFAWFSMDYRLTPQVRHPEQLEDVRRALAFLRRQSDRFRIDPARLALLGESASGQMALQLAAEAESKIAAVVSFYGVYDFPALVRDASPRSLLTRLFGLTVLDEESRRVLKRYSPLYQVHAGMPPVLLIHGTAEILWDQAVALQRKLQETGVPHELYRLEGAPHGMENWEGHPEWLGYKEKMVEWLTHHLQTARPN